MAALAFSDRLSVGQTYTFEYVPKSLLDVVVNTWGLQAALVKDWGAYASFDKVSFLGTLKITFRPGTDGGTVASWNEALSYSLKNFLWGGDVSFLKAEGGEGGSLFDPVLKPLGDAAKTATTLVTLAVVGLALYLAIDSGLFRKG